MASFPPVASLVRVLAVCQKEVIHLVHDRLTFGMVVMIPLLQLVLFGYTINTDVRHVPAAVADQTNNSFSRQLIADLQATQVVDFIHGVDTPQQLEALIQDGSVGAGLFIPPDAERRYYEGDRSTGQLLVDGSDTTLAGAVRQLGNFPFIPGGAVANRDSVPTLSVRLLYNPQSRAALFTVPGLLGVILTMTMIMFTSIAIVRERERGNIELLITTPIRNIELMVGKITPYIGIGLIQVSVILLLGSLLFNVPIGGKLLPVYSACLVFILANLTLGLMISTFVNNQLAAMQMSFFILLPSILLSGFMFPFVAMPDVAQKLAEVLPLTHFLRIIRGVILRGEQLNGAVGDLLYLACFALVFLIISTFRFTKRLD
ncbi:ABC transporter permease [Desulfopila sp. IMCC35008]|uniref:ABC transporter permease n=1 Tax=Desulfopila sp. IMCC35008 TaxID=2653858 RepID=UPI0013D803B6|nr:ABC transporter permease [Desulfopila sp. IMCC35008]